jgi:uncharacterized membrane protein YedE/YeeE
MLGALIPSGAAYLWIRARRTPLLAVSLLHDRIIDRRLVIGAAIFGLGSGRTMSRPSHRVAGNRPAFAIIFATAMIAGVLLHGLIHRPTATTGKP